MSDGIMPSAAWMQRGGKQGVHSEHLGHLLAEKRLEDLEGLAPFRGYLCQCQVGAAKFGTERVYSHKDFRHFVV